MIASGVLSLAGLIGVPLANMHVRNIGIVGYLGVGSLVFLLLGIVWGRVQHVSSKTEPSPDGHTGTEPVHAGRSAPHRA